MFKCRQTSHRINFSNQLCLFRCLACHRAEGRRETEKVHSGGRRRPWGLERETKSLFHAYGFAYRLSHNVDSFQGLEHSELDKFEQFFKVNMKVYSMQPSLEDEDTFRDCKLIRRSLGSYDDMNINQHQHHVGYITDLKLYSKSYMCSTCKKMWRPSWSMKRYAQTCKEKVRYIYKGGV